VSLFSENGGRWLVADQAVMKCGAADAVGACPCPACAVLLLTAPHALLCLCGGLFAAHGLPAHCLPHLLPARSPQVRGTSSSLEELQYILQHRWVLAWAAGPIDALVVHGPVVLLCPQMDCSLCHY
jgi:long-chain acyl-CoA synthetase